MQRNTTQQPRGPAADKALRKYLAQHAEPEAARIRECLAADRRYGHVLCIAAYGEGEGLVRSLSSVPEGPRGAILIIVVVNESKSSPDWVRVANQDSLTALRGHRAGARSEPCTGRRCPSW